MARKRRRQRDEAPGWVWMTFGLGIGLVVALAVYLNGRQPESTPVPQAAIPAPDEPLEPATTEPSPSAPATTTRSNAAGPAEDPDRFSFYELLPRFEVVVPEVETPAPRRAPAAAIEEPGVYVLQAGSFGNAEDAERQRANLALLGLESRVQRVSIDDRTFHRVRIGPIEELEELNAVRARLREANVDFMIMRMSD